MRIDPSTTPMLFDINNNQRASHMLQGFSLSVKVTKHGGQHYCKVRTLAVETAPRGPVGHKTRLRGLAIRGGAGIPVCL